MKRPNLYLSLLFLGLVLALATVNFNYAHVSAQDSSTNQVKRWVVIFHQQNDLPSRVDQRVADAGGTIAAQLPEVGAVVALSSNPSFAVDMANDSSVSDVAEDIEVQMIPTPERLQAQPLDDLNALGDGPVEPPGSDARQGPSPSTIPFSGIRSV